MSKKREDKVKDRASVVFGRPGTKPYNDATKKAKKGGGCFGGCFEMFLGYPSDSHSSQYGDPQPLETIPLCQNWADLKDGRKNAVKHVELLSTAKEHSPGWINQDATVACAAPGNGEGCGDLAAGATHDGSLIFCVFDGHGRSGHEVAKIAAERLPAHLAGFQGGALSNPKKAIEDAFRKTDDDIYKKMGPDVEYSGSTGVAVLMDPAKRMLYVGNVGDSRAVVGQYLEGDHVNASTIALTEDLKPCIPEERHRIEMSGGVVMHMVGDDGDSQDCGPLRVWDSALREKPGLAVSRSLGDGASRHLGVIAEPVITTHQMVDTDRFMLLATDGLWDSLGNSQAVQITAKYLQKNLPQVACKALTEAVRREEGGQTVDDTTIALIVF